MSLDDDFFVGAMTSKGWWAFIFFALMVGVMFWQCSQSKKCESANAVYAKDLDMCVNKDALSKPENAN